MLGAMYGATTGESGRLVPRLARAYPRAMALVDAAAARGRARRSVTTLLGRSSPRPGAAWHEVQSRASQPDATAADERRARLDARGTGAASPATSWCRAARRSGRCAGWRASAPGWPRSARRRRQLRAARPASGPGLRAGAAPRVLPARRAHRAHARGARRRGRRGRVATTARGAGELLFGDFPVDFPLDLAIVDSYAAAPSDADAAGRGRGPATPLRAGWLEPNASAWARARRDGEPAEHGRPARLACERARRDRVRGRAPARRLVPFRRGGCAEALPASARFAVPSVSGCRGRRHRSRATLAPLRRLRRDDRGGVDAGERECDEHAIDGLVPRVRARGIRTRQPGGRRSLARGGQAMQRESVVGGARGLDQSLLREPFEGRVRLPDVDRLAAPPVRSASPPCSWNPYAGPVVSRASSASRTAIRSSSIDE